MSTGTDLNFPKNDDIFEDICLDLWKKLLGDSEAQRNGRRGHKQNGVDIYGHDEKGNLIGIQAKKKDLLVKNRLMEREVLKEVEEAKSFEPPLAKYIIATTALRDPEIQKLARKITKEHQKKGLFSVTVFFWEDISHELKKFPELVEYYELGLTINKTEVLESKIDKLLASNSRIEQNLISSSEISEDLPEIYQSNFNYVKSLLENFKPKEALIFLDNIENNILDDQTPKIAKYEFLKFKGLAKHRLLKNEEAGNLLVQAYEYNKDDINAKYNKGWGHLFLNKSEEAEEIAEEILNDNPEDITANQIFIFSSDQDLNEIISKIPDHILDSKDIAYSLGIISRERKQFKESEKWLRIAAKNSSKCSPDFKANLGEVILENLINPLLVYSNQVSIEESKKLKEVCSLLQEAWDELSSSDAKKSRLSWIVNKSTTKRILGDLDGALNDINLALELDNSPDLIVKKSFILDEIGLYTDAKILLENLDEKEVPEKPIFLAKVISDNEDYTKAIQILETFLETGHDAKLTHDARDLLAQLYIANEDLKNARRVIKPLLKAGNDISSLIYASRISTLSEEPESNSYLDEAIERLDNDTSIRELLLLADELFNLERLKEAASVYERFVDKEINTDLTCKLVDCYYRSGEIGKAFTICKKLREVYNKPLKFFSEIEISIYNEIDDLDSAKNLIDDYLKIYSNNLEMKINQAFVDLRSNNLEMVDSFIDSHISSNAMTLQQFSALIRLCNIRDYNEEVLLDLLYEMRRKYFDEYQAHAEYIQNFFSKEKNIETNPQKVDLGTAVCLEIRGQNEWFVLERNEDINLKINEINSTHPLFEKLKDKEVDDEIVINENSVAPIKGKIIEIKNKYVHALHESMHKIDYSPENLGMSSFTLEEDEENKFEPLFKILKDKAERDQNIENLFMKKWIPLGTYSKIMNSNVLDVWLNIVNKFNLSLKCYTGSRVEKSSRVLLKNDVRLIVDLVSLLTIKELGIGEVIVNTFGKLGIAQSSVDVLNQILYESLANKGREYITTSWNNGEPVYQDVTPEDTERRIEYVENIIKLVRSNCEILPCEAALKINRKKRFKYNDLLCKSFVDTILIATKEGNLLFSDDAPFRRLAYSEFNLHGVWTQAVLDECLERNNLEKSDYNKAIIRLIRFNYKSMTIDADTVLEALKESNWLLSQPYISVIETLINYDQSSVARVLVDFLRKLNQESISTEKNNVLIHNLFYLISLKEDGNQLLTEIIRFSVRLLNIKFRNLRYKTDQ
ncbi:hypothetical protein [Methanobacterium sp.]|uniref:tetratricopeptide repeat protein n=1 Tax=Methanobacterium sp. TaxID=2164 RepID=UPI0025E0C229|nr:hypothetical protein [Methanobacterium sp.]MBI5458930.1 hypothetical protein [Methanobacterium sp.]